MWTTEAAVAAWQAPPTGERGGQPASSAIALETCLALRLVFHQPPRRTEGLVGSTAELLEAAAVPSETTVTRRDHRVAEVAKHGRMGWQRRSGYNRRSLAETATCRCTAIAGRRLHARTLPNQQAGAKIGRNVLNRVAGIGMPASARVR